MAGPQRVKKINEVIKRELGKVILREIGFPKNILVTLTSVETSKDLRGCKVFVSVLPEKESANVLRTLEKEVYYLQQFLNQRLSLKFVPKIKFLEDKKLKKVQRVEKILNEIRKNEQG